MFSWHCLHLEQGVVLCCRIAATCWTFHFAKRLLETVFVHRFSHATMPIANIFRVSVHENQHRHTQWIGWWFLGSRNKLNIFFFRTDTKKPIIIIIHKIKKKKEKFISVWIYIWMRNWIEKISLPDSFWCELDTVYTVKTDCKVSPFGSNPLGTTGGC